MNDDNSLDLLDLDDDNGSMDTLPDAVPFGARYLCKERIQACTVRR